MIEPTDEMVQAYYAARAELNREQLHGRPPKDSDTLTRAGLAAVLALIERDYCAGAKGHEHVEPSVEDWDWVPTKGPRCGKPIGENMLCARPQGHGFPPCGFPVEGGSGELAS